MVSIMIVTSYSLCKPRILLCRCSIKRSPIKFICVRKSFSTNHGRIDEQQWLVNIARNTVACDFFLRERISKTSGGMVDEQVFTMSVTDTRTVVGTSNRHIWVYDMRSLLEPEQRRVSSLKFQTRCVRVFPDKSGYAVGSVEGRVAVEYFDMAKVSKRFRSMEYFRLFSVYRHFFSCIVLLFTLTIVFDMLCC